MKIILPLFLLLAGCTTPVPIHVKFPDAPSELTMPCDKLEHVKNGATLSDLETTVIQNYEKYHYCSAKVLAWNQWYTENKKDFK